MEDSLLCAVLINDRAYADIFKMASLNVVERFLRSKQSVFIARPLNALEALLQSKDASSSRPRSKY